MARSRSRTSRHQPAPPPPPTRYSVEAVQQAYVPFYWDFVVKYIEAALEHAHGELNAEDVFVRMMDGRMALLVIRDENHRIHGAVAWELVIYPRKKCVRVVCLGGDGFDGWKVVLNETLKKIAERTASDAIEAYVRRGLVPKMQDVGYRETYVGMELWARAQAPTP